MPEPDKELLQELARKRVKERARCKADKLFLARQLGYDFVPSVHEELFAHYIVYDPAKPWAEQSEKKKRLILWPRGTFKTTSMVVEVIQAILNFPDIRILLMQGTAQVTRTFLSQIAAHFLGTAQGSRFQELFPEFCGVQDETGEWKFGKKILNLTADHFTTPARKKKQLPQATCTVASTRTVKTGQHYDLGVFDDLINDQNYRNPRLLAKVAEDYYMCQPLIDPPHFQYVSGTRYAFGELYETIQRNNTGEWIITIKTCWKEGKDFEPLFPRQKTVDGRLIGNTKEELLALQRDDPGMFASQYLNQPVSAGTQQFTAAMLEENRIEPVKELQQHPVVLFVDLASTDSLKSDDSVIVSGKVDALGRVYATEIRGGQWIPSLLALQVIDMAMKYRPMRIYFEKTASCIYFTDYLREVARNKGVNLPIDYIKIDNTPNAKSIRISSVVGRLRNKVLFFYNTIDPITWSKVVEQFVRFTPGKNNNVHDDYPDTIALMCLQFGQQIAVTVPLAASQATFFKVLQRQGVDITKEIVEPRSPTEEIDNMGDGF